MKRKQQATTSGEDYLEAILVLQMQKRTVRSKLYPAEWTLIV